jgi:hypothetical protein
MISAGTRAENAALHMPACALRAQENGLFIYIGLQK